jgi:U3 small nucleolar RNA-associated protein MPP10
MEGETQADSLSDFVELLAQPDASAASLLWNKKVAAEQLHPVLLETTQQLFRRIEHLASLYRDHVEDSQQPEVALSGLQELYTGSDDQKVDTETLWGQVDLQNEALQSLLKSSIRKLHKASGKTGTNKEIRLLDDIESDNEAEIESEAPSDAEDGVGDDDGDASQNSGSEDEDEHEDENEDAHTKRIRERMERAMADMDEEEEEEDFGEEAVKERDTSRDEEEDIVDPAAEELNNGFFDINEMEAFADEEEEYLPDSAFGADNPDAEKDVEDKKSFHQKQRDGDMDSGSDENDDDDEEDLLFRKESLVRRKRYREDDEVDALDDLYGKSKQDVEEDDDDDDVINMTATGFFGKPNKKYFGKWAAQNKTSGKGKEAKGDGDDDSWNDFDFNNQNEDEEPSAWNNDSNQYNNEDDGSGEGSDNDEDDEHADEVIAIKGRTSKDDVVKGSKKSKLQAQTEELETEMMAEKPWQMTGETTSSTRPTNSLLQATPEFEVATKMAPIITAEHTMSLEDVIKKRVLEEDWDDVIPRELPDVGWQAKRGELPEVSQEKSKLGLGELYEREYLKKAVGYDVDAAEEESEEQKAKNEIKTLFANVCSKLDALSNYHFAPRPIENEAEIRIVTKPAIAMEEVLPLHVSDARGVAPEQVYGQKHGRESVLRADSEMEQEDRKRLRSSKKAVRRKKRQEKHADEKLISRLQPGLGLNNPYEKRKMREELSVARARGVVTEGKTDTNDYGGSGTFFKRMEEQAKQTIRGSKEETAQADERKSSKSSSFKL